MKCLIFGGWDFPCFFAARTAACQASSCAHLPICRGHKSCHLGLGKSCDQMTGSNQQVQLGCFFRKKHSQNAIVWSSDDLLSCRPSASYNIISYLAVPRPICICPNLFKYWTQLELCSPVRNIKHPL